MVNDNNDLSVAHTLRSRDLLPMIGGLPLVENMLYDLLEQIRPPVHQGKGVCAHNKQPYNVTAEQEVSKSEAIDHYLEMRDLIDSRLKAITKSDKRLRFRINKSQINNL